MFDIIIKEGEIIDGTGRARYRADIGIVGDRITAIGELGSEPARTAISAAGKIVAPGFVDTHNHSDGWLLKEPHLEAKTRQGFTTEVIMSDGISYAPLDEHTAPEWLFYMRSLNALQFSDYDGWLSLADYMSRIDGNNVQNAITQIPYANLRAMACGFGRGAPDDVQMRDIRAAVEQGMAEGAVGLSTGLDYISQCFASTDELVEVCTAMAPQKGIYATHMRYKKGTLPALKEAVEIGRRADVPVHISHLKSADPQEAEEILEYIDGTARNEVDFTFDVYPYLPGSTTLDFLLPYEIWEDGPLAAFSKLADPRLRTKVAAGLEGAGLDRGRIAWLPGKENSIHLGKTLSEYIDFVGKPPEDAICDLLIEEQLSVLCVYHHGADDLVHPFLSHDCYMMGSDGVYFPDGLIHPRMYGSAPRLLGPCVRDHRLFSLEEAVRKLSGHAAERFGLTRRGHLEEGYFADVVIFDPATVVDRATFEDPHQYPEGIESVLVNGTVIIENSRGVEDLSRPLPGRYLKFNSV
jgi:N-acyl-D-amino-acid deacylase